MPGRQILPDSGTLAQMRRHMTIAEIAEEYGVSQQAVWYKLRDAGLTENRPPNSMPWTVRTEHLQSRPALMLRALAKLNRGEELPAQKLRSLEIWRKELDDLGVVVDYAPETPPNPASPIHGGFFYVPRTAEDGEGYTRNPDSATEDD
jgi:hypothetical protein